jgi:hypothetical protein
MAAKRHKTHKSKGFNQSRNRISFRPLSEGNASHQSIQAISFYAPFAPFGGNETAVFRINLDFGFWILEF